MINVGVIGVGCEWETWQRALQSLRLPVRIAAIYDCVEALARRTAATLEAETANSLSGLAANKNVEAILLLDAGWMGESSLKILLKAGKPVFVRPWLNASIDFCKMLFEKASEDGQMIMPAMWRRFIPSTMRLQELLATELGTANRLEIQLSADSPQALLKEKLVGWIDFSQNLFRATPAGTTFQGNRLIVDFASSQTQQKKVTEIVFCEETADLSSIGKQLSRAIESTASIPVPGESQLEHSQVRCECKNGQATIHDRTTLEWSSDRFSENGSINEELTSERPEEQVMLDVFCRRLVGGLIPVADFGDIGQALELLAMTEESASANGL